jgi:hypothetical protein
MILEENWKSKKIATSTFKCVNLIMKSDGVQNETYEKDSKPVWKRHLHVKSVVYPVQTDNDDRNRKAHSSPIKGYRRFSEQEPSNNNQVSYNAPYVYLHPTHWFPFSWHCRQWTASCDRWENKGPIIIIIELTTRTCTKNQCYSTSKFALFIRRHVTLYVIKRTTYHKIISVQQHWNVMSYKKNKNRNVMQKCY